MIVYDNIVFGLKFWKMLKFEIKKRVEEVVKIFGLEEYLYCKLKVLLGG